MWTLKGPCKAFFEQGSPKISHTGFIVTGYPKKCYPSLKGPRKCKMQMMYTKPIKSKRIIRFNYSAVYGSLMDQGWTLTLFGSAFVTLESIGILFVA